MSWHYPSAALRAIAEVNPKTKLSNEVEQPFIAMDAIIPGIRYVSAKKLRKVGGGARFQGGDTLMARITPCLENGKIAQYQPGASAAFGSTEFIVIRARPEICDPAFLFYLVRSPIVTCPAIASMSGASGRQRADAKVVADTQVPCPPLNSQRRIGAVLSAYDDLIDVNRRRVAVLEEMARGLFEELVARPAGGLPPAGSNHQANLSDGWQLARLGEIAEIRMGQSPTASDLNNSGIGIPFHQGVTDFGTLYPTDRIYCQNPSPKRTAEVDDILFSVRAPVGRINIATSPTLLGRGIASIRGVKCPQMFLTVHMRATFFETDLIGNGAIYKAVGRSDIERVQIILPPEAALFAADQKLKPIYSLLWTLEQSKRRLAASRDLLLPRLISGELSVVSAEREQEEVA